MKETKDVIEHMCTRFVTDRDKVKMYSLCYKQDGNVRSAFTMTPKEVEFNLKESKYLMDDDEFAKVLLDNAISIATKSMYNYDIDFDLDLSRVPENAEMIRRRLITRILLVNSMMDVESRTGLGIVLILSRAAFDFINLDGAVSDAGYFMTMKCIPYDGVGNRIVVMRKSEHTAYFIQHRDDVNKYRFIPAVDEVQSNRQHMAFRLKLF